MQQMMFKIIFYFTIIMISVLTSRSEDFSLESQYIFSTYPKLDRQDTRIFKMVLDKEKQYEFMQSMNMLPPNMNVIASQSRKKELIQESFDSDIIDYHSFLADNGNVKINQQDSAYFQYYKEYIQWKKTSFTIMYILTTKPNKKGEYAIKGVLTGMNSSIDPLLLLNKVYTTKEQLESMPARISSNAKTLIEEFQALIDKKEVEDITNRNIIPTRIHALEREKADLILSILKGFNDINVHEVPQAVTLKLQENIAGFLPLINPKAKRSRKQDDIIDAIEFGEVDIAGYLRMNGYGFMNSYDRAFTQYHEAYSNWKYSSFSHAYVITKKDNATILGLVLTPCQYRQEKSLDCFEHARKTYLRNQLLSMNFRDDKQTLLELFTVMLRNKEMQQIHP